MAGLTTQALDIIAEMEQLRSADDVWSCFLRFARQYGFQFGALCETPSANERFQDTIVCLAWPEGWSQRYFEQDYFSRDPAALQAFQSTTPYMFHELAENKTYSTSQRRIVHEASEFGMPDGLVIPILTIQHGMTYVTVGGTTKELALRERVELQIAAIYAHARVRELTPNCRRTSVPILTPRERECLSWAAAGKSDWEIGGILSIAERTVTAHLESVRRKYGVTNRSQAIAIGMRAGAVKV